MRTSRHPAAFTLLEVIVAMVIMAVTMSALLVTFRTALNAWDTGHGMSEIMQSARISQEVMLRDLNNLVYLNESNYNRSFRQQLDTLASQVANPADPLGQARLNGTRRRRGEGKEAGALGDLDSETIAMPINLTFEGSDGGSTDRLSFARFYTPRLPTDPDTWGVRRVAYYVKDKTLYREESDPFGFSPGQAAEDYYSSIPALASTASHFMKPKEASLEQALEFLPLPLQYNVAEPLCEGVELLNMNYGYFIDGEWHEAGDWDSGAIKYRHPPEDDDPINRAAGPVNIGAGMMAGSDIMQRTLAQQARNKPDDLPGYVAIQLGVRAPGNKKGRLYSFTFYYSMPMAHETDIYIDPTAPGNGGRGSGTRSSNQGSRRTSLSFGSGR